MGVEIKGLNEAIKKIENLANLGKNTEPLMNSIAGTLKNEIEFSFENEKSPFGERWKPLKEKTLKEKLKKGKSKNILVRDGNLSNNWLTESSNSKAVVFNNSENKSVFKYGLAHQFGSSKQNIPTRPFLPINKNHKLPKKVENEIVKMVDKFIEKEMKKG